MGSAKFISNRHPAVPWQRTTLFVFYFIPAGVKKKIRAALMWFDLINSFFFFLMRSPSYTRLNLNNIVHKYFREREKKKKTWNSWSQRLSVPKFSGTEKKKKKLCAYVCVCVHIHPSAFLFSRVVRDAPATGNIPIVSFPSIKKSQLLIWFYLGSKKKLRAAVI